MTISSPGVGSGLDVNGIVTQLMTIEAQPLAALNTREASYLAKISAYGGLKGALSSFQDAARALTDNNKYHTIKASASDASVLTASATNSAAPGASYSIEVTQLARTQKLATAGQASATAIVGTGTLSFEFGTIAQGSGSFDTNTGQYTGATFTSNGAAAKTVTIDAAHNTLNGIRDAINAAKIGVTASIVNVGGATPFRLTLSPAATGEANSLKITATGDAALGALLAHDPQGTQNLSETSSAQNAKLVIDGLPVTRPSNTISGAIPDVTLNLVKTNTGAPVTVSTARDMSALAGAVEGLVKAYNDLNRSIADLTSYDQATGSKGLLLGDSAVRSVHGRLRATLSTALNGAGGLNNLSQLGISFQKDGMLALDSAKLQAAISGNPEGVAGFFAANSNASDNQITVTGTTSRTRPGTYPINITALATQGKATGSATISGSLTISTGVNDQLAITVDSVSTTINLPPGTYTASAMADAVQSAINGASAMASARVSVTQSAGIISITSDRYGPASRVAVTGGTAMADVMGTAPTSVDGTDVTGTINGTPATGSGQTLSGKSGAATEGLKLLITGGATGNRGTVSYVQGMAHKLEALAGSMLDNTGPISSRTDGMNRSIKDIGGERDRLNQRLVDKEKQYRAQFNALDSLVASLNRTSAFLTQQLASLSSSNSKN